MISSLITYLSLVVVVGLWHAILTALRGEPGWVRTILRVAIAGTTIIQAVAFTVVTSMTSNVPVNELPAILNRVSMWTQVSDGASVVLLGVGALLLTVFTVRRGVRGPIA